jgi:hypothetical protein
MPLMRMPVIVAVMMTFSTEEPCTGDIHGQAETRDRDRLGEMDRNRREDTADRFVVDQEPIIARMIALVKPARSPTLPVPNVKRGSLACLRA